jgi:signal transduction histidine kinase
VSTPAKHVWPLNEHELSPALRVIVSLAHADMGVLMLHDDSDHTLLPVLAHGMTPSQFEGFGAVRAGEGPFGTALAEHRLVRVRNVWNDPVFLHEAARRLGFRHLEILPFFRADGGALGAFAILYRGRSGSPRGSARLTRDCADLVAVAVSHARAHVQVEGERAHLAQAAHAKVQFVAKMSHELRTPLQSISGYINLLQSGPTNGLSADQIRMLTRIAVSEHLLVHIIDDLISFSRLEAGQMTYRIRPVSVHDAMTSVEEVLSPLALAQKVDLKLTDGHADLKVRADETKLQQILVNLVSNGIKHAKSGGVVRMDCRVDGDNVLFDVADDGQGIPRERLQDIFDPYVQLESSKNQGANGWGLGLAISRELSQGMSGRLTVRSEVGRGSVFTLQLPRATPTVMVPAPPRIPIS